MGCDWMKTPKDNLLYPYKATHAETVDNMTVVVSRLSNADGPLAAIAQLTDAVSHGVGKHTKGDWRTRTPEYFLPKALRHLRQHYGASVFAQALHEISVSGAFLPEYIDAESGVAHLVKAATNILMAHENCQNAEEPAEDLITADELGMTYLAMPYTKNPELSCQVASEVAHGCALEGIQVYAPTVYGHVVAKDGTYDYWIKHGLRILKACDSITLVQHRELGTWEDSDGCQKELLAARSAGLKVFEFDYETKKTRRLEIKKARRL